jgi:excisionase family DNA binding protein
MNERLVEIPTLDSLMADPGKVVELSPAVARTLLIGLVCLQPLLIERALMGQQVGQREDELLTVPEVAKRLKVSNYRAYELVRQGTLKSVRLGKKSVRVRPAALAEYLA